MAGLRRVLKEAEELGDPHLAEIAGLGRRIIIGAAGPDEVQRAIELQRQDAEQASARYRASRENA